ncbi:MAG: metallophosphoesterase [Gemmatimonadota bacterium]
MNLAHIADPHLGYRAYHRAAPDGRNQRERDVSDGFEAAIQGVLRLGPDLVLIAGDVFHAVRPPNAAITDAFRQILRLRAGLPDSPIVIISGNHDAPRSAETGSILRLFAEIPGVHVADGRAPEAVRVQAGGADTSVLCVPYAALARGEPLILEPDPAARHNVLLMHATVVGGPNAQKIRRGVGYGGIELGLEELRPERWTYVALGHYHVATELAPNTWYAGATESTSTNIWAEAEEPNGFVTFDTVSASARFHPIATRPVLDLEPLSGRAPGGDFLDPAVLDERIGKRVDAVPGGIDGKLVRLVLREAPRAQQTALDHERLRSYRARALHFHLDVRRPDRAAAPRAPATPPERRLSLEEEVGAFLRDWQPSAADLDAPRLARLAEAYLARAGDGGAA